MAATVITAVICIGALYALRTFRDYRNACATMQNVPGYVSFIDASSPLSSLFNERRWFVMGRFNLFKNKRQMYDNAGWDIHPAISLWPRVQTSLVISDATALKEVCSSRTRFPKPVELYESLLFFGSNIVTAEGDEWKKSRKIAAPAFSERNLELVWTEACKIMLDLFDNVWKDKKETHLDNALDMTLSIALQTIGIAGFGRNISSNSETTPPPGYELTFKTCLQIVSSDVFLRLVIGEWLPNFTDRIRLVRTAFDELKRYMYEMIHVRQTLQATEGHKGARYDLFSGLIDANSDENNALSESELVGNIFIYLLAGHETTAHTLCYTFALLALYPDEQEKLYQHCKSVSPGDEAPSYEKMNLFTQSLAVWNETLRFFPPVIGIPKVAAEDTVLSTMNDQGETKTFPVTKGTQIIVHPPGLHFNPRYWKDPETFNPDRFLGLWNRDAFLPYSGGARSCLGRRFAETEAIAIVTLSILRYKITVTEEPQFAGETFEMRKTRVLDSSSGITLTPKRVPLTFTSRS
ncbi:cytochrome P450 [Mycena floridula]|nr:cytochrome P450 [Mycena floridula]